MTINFPVYRAKELTNQLHSRGYLKQDITSVIDKARQRSRDALLSYRSKSAEVGTILSFVLTYHPDLPMIRDIVDKNWSIIESSNELKDIYQNKHSWLSDVPKAFVISWLKHDSNQTLMMTTKMVNVDPMAEKNVNAAK